MIRVRTLTAVAVAVALLASSVRAAEPEKFLPDDTTMVVTFNIKQTLESGLGKKYLLPAVKQAMEGNAQANQVFTALGFDPLKDFESLTIASSGVSSTDPMKEVSKVVAVAHGSFDLKKIGDTGDMLVKQDKLKSSMEGSTRVYESTGSDQKGYFAFIDKNTLVLSGNKSNVSAAIKGGGKGPKLSKDMTALLEKVEGKQSMWFAAILPDELKKLMASRAETMAYADKLKSFSGGVTFDKDFALNLAVHTSEAKTADEIAKALDGIKVFGKVALGANEDVKKQLGEKGLKALGDLIDSIMIKANKETATISIKVSEDTITELMKLAPKTP